MTCVSPFGVCLLLGVPVLQLPAFLGDPTDRLPSMHGSGAGAGSPDPAKSRGCCCNYENCWATQQSIAKAFPARGGFVYVNKPPAVSTAAKPPSGNRLTVRLRKEKHYQRILHHLQLNGNEAAFGQQGKHDGKVFYARYHIPPDVLAAAPHEDATPYEYNVPKAVADSLDGAGVCSYTAIDRLPEDPGEFFVLPNYKQQRARDDAAAAEAAHARSSLLSPVAARGSTPRPGAGGRRR